MFDPDQQIQHHTVIAVQNPSAFPDANVLQNTETNVKMQTNCWLV